MFCQYLIPIEKAEEDTAFRKATTPHPPICYDILGGSILISLYLSEPEYIIFKLRYPRLTKTTWKAAHNQGLI
jgi:hypothetical protein